MYSNVMELHLHEKNVKALDSEKYREGKMKQNLFRGEKIMNPVF